MAVIITNMDMPKCCKDCIFWNYYEGNCRKIKVSEWKDFDTDEEYEKRAHGCPLKSADDYKPILDKIRAEIEQLPTSYVEIFTRHSGVKYRDMVELGAVTRIFDKHRAESGGK